MTLIPQIQIQQTNLKMEYETTPATLDIQLSKVNLNYERVPSQFRVDVTQASQLEINLDRTWEATGRGGNEFFTNQIYTESRNVVRQAIARIIDDGARMAQVTNGTVIHELHRDKPLDALEFNYTGPASSDNVDISYTPKQIEITIDPGRLSINPQKQEAQYTYTPSKFDAYVRQMNRVDITPPQLNYKY